MGLSSLLLCLLATLWLCSSAQILDGEEQILMLKVVIDGQDKIMKYLKEQQGGMMVLKEADAQTKEYLQGLQTKVEELEENQRSLLETQRIIAETQLRQEEILNSVEQHLQKDPVVDLINILEKNACQDGSHNCSINAKCIDQFMSYECQCLPGFKGDGYVCDDINECYDQPCHHNATCSNTDGSYTCSCDKPYQGDGITCETICQSPSIEVIGLGCITAILEWGPWETQKERCEDMGMQLVEDFKKEHITIFSKAFGSQMHDDKQPWVGARKGKWAISGKPVPHDMWLSGEPDRGIEDCVYMRLRKNEANGLGDSSKCLNNGRALCQLLY